MTQSKTKIRFWGGLKTIGGTIVTVEYNKSRVIFDFGLVYSPATQIFDGRLKLRDSALVKDYLRLGAIPMIDGIYSKSSFDPSLSLIPAEESELNTAVLISHLHLDHIGAMGLISPEIPIYMSEESKRLYEGLYKIGEGVPGDQGRSYRACRLGNGFNVGDIQITPIAIDHDIPGACGFRIETPDGTLVYTGDLRFHGHHPERTHAFIEQVKNMGLDILITEGTTLSSVDQLPDEAIYSDPSIPDEMLTELTLPEQIMDYCKEKEGLLVFNGYHRNLLRVKGLIEVAKRAGRTAVLEPETAFLFDTFYFNKDYAVFMSSETKQKLETDQAPKWLYELLQHHQSSAPEVINENPERYILENSYENSMDLFDLDLTNGLYIHSNGVPLGPFDPAYTNLERVLDLLQLEKVNVLAGGHAIPTHLKYFVDTIDPKILIPLHSFYPERLLPNSGEQLLPKYGVTYILDNHLLVEDSENTH